MTVPTGFVPEALQPLQGTLRRWLPWLVKEDGDIVLGPDPEGRAGRAAGQPQAARRKRSAWATRRRTCAMSATWLLKLKLALASAPPKASDEELRERFAQPARADDGAEQVPDFVVNRGHYFGTAQFNRQDGLSADEKAFGTEPELSDEDKRALIAFLKTF